MLGQAARADVPVVLVMGDSLSAGYGMRADQGWVALLQRRLTESGYGYRVVNASATGETTGGGLTRLPRALEKHRPAVVIIELGGNDGLRGLPVRDIRANLTELVKKSRASGARVLILGMQVPPNYGQKYAQDFAGLFAGVSKAEGAALVPFFLAGVADGPEADQLFQADRIHPNAQAQARMLENVWPVLKPLLK
jgi:acyl-CoA thioesterase-1